MEYVTLKEIMYVREKTNADLCSIKMAFRESKNIEQVIKKLSK